MSDIILPGLGIPNMPQNNYLACSVSGPPINVPVITHESGENQNPLRSPGYLLEILVKMYQYPFISIVSIVKSTYLHTPWSRVLLEKLTSKLCR
jgi:hypothetical protein